jgi:hypothetical protein
MNTGRIVGTEGNAERPVYDNPRFSEAGNTGRIGGLSRAGVASPRLRVSPSLPKLTGPRSARPGGVFFRLITAQISALLPVKARRERVVLFGYVQKLPSRLLVD